MLPRQVSLGKQLLLRDSALTTEHQVSYGDIEEKCLDVEHGKARRGHLFSIPFLISNFWIQVDTTTFPILYRKKFQLLSIICSSHVDQQLLTPK